VTSYKKHASCVEYDAGHAGLIQRVRDAISNSGAPAVVKDMINISIDYSLAVEKKSRHKFQEEVVETIATILSDEEEKLVQGIEDIKDAVEKSDLEKLHKLQLSILPRLQRVRKQKHWQRYM